MREYRRSFGPARLTIVFASLWTAISGLQAQSFKDHMPPEVTVQRASGDSIQPIFDGWNQNADGTATMWFGYMNRNYQQQLDVPIGPKNSFNPNADRGQPTHFYPRRHQYVFKVDLPKGWTKENKLIWTVTANGETCTATGWLQPEWQVDDGVRMMNAGGAGLAPPESNEAPKIKSGSPDQTIAVGKPLKLAVEATDDGIPKPRGRGGRGGTGVKWIVYRAQGEVVFDPDETAPVYGKPVGSNTVAYFGSPGVYWIRAVASDGLLEAVHDVRVTVTE